MVDIEISSMEFLITYQAHPVSQTDPYSCK